MKIKIIVETMDGEEVYQSTSDNFPDAEAELSRAERYLKREEDNNRLLIDDDEF